MTNKEEDRQETDRQNADERDPDVARQNAGYDEAADGNPPVKLDVMDITAAGQEKSRSERLFDTAADEAANDVRRREHSAD